ncbi:unnamed protein product [Phaeothamnion confervicola]
MPEPLHYREGKFNSATIDVNELQVEDTTDFALKLYATIQHLRGRGKAALWLKVPLDFAHYIPVASFYGLRLHHTTPDTIFMVMWLQENVPNKVPHFATHHVGVAGCVVNDADEVLLVREARTLPAGSWKFPGGLAEPGEDLGEAAAREVREETGITAEFQSVLTIRHQHKMQFGNSDLFFVCRMRALSSDITACAHEIAEARWVPMAHLRGATADNPMLGKVARMLASPAAVELIESEHESIVPGRPPFKLYHRPLADS